MGKVVKAVGQIAGIVAMIPGPWQPIAAGVAAVAGVATALIGNPASQPPPARGSVTQLQIEVNAPQPYVMGEGYFAGVLRHRASYGATIDGVPNPYRGMAVVYSGGGPVQSISPRVDFGTVPAWYTGFLYTDTQTGATPEASALSPQWAGLPGWGTASKLSGQAAILWSLQFDKEGKKFAGGLPQLGAYLQGVKVYDPRLDSTRPGGSGAHRLNDESTWGYDDNPALHAPVYAYGRHQNGKRVLGIGLPEANIDWETVAAWANVCDANGWTMFGVVYEPGDRWANLKDICAAGGGQPVFNGAVLSFRYHAPAVSLDTVTEADLADEDSSVAAMQSWRNRLNTVIPKYRSPAHNWELVSAAAVSVSSYLTEDGEEKAREWPFNFVKDKDQAAQLAAYKLVDSRELNPIRITCKPRLRAYRAGDCLTLNLPQLGLNTKATILRREVDPQTLTVKLELQGESDGKDAYALGLTGTAPATPGVGLSAEERDLIGGATAGDGAAGANGLNSARPRIYQRAASSPALPSGTTTWTFATTTLTGLDNGWTTTIPTSNGQPLWVSEASAASTASTDTIAAGEWAGPVILVQDGTDGEAADAGLNSATVRLYRRSVGAPTLPTTVVTYTFATGASSGVNNGWTRTIPAPNGQKLWTTQATAIGTGATDEIPASEWAAAEVLVQDALGTVTEPFNPGRIGGAGNLVFKLNTANGTTEDAGEIRVEGTRFLHPDGVERTLTSPHVVTTNYGEGQAGRFFLAYTAEAKATRFGTLGTQGTSGANIFVCRPRASGGGWEAVDNSGAAETFTPQVTDCLLAAVEAEATTGGLTAIVPLVSGIEGVQGPTGAQGPTGPQGPQGPEGPQGLAATAAYSTPPAVQLPAFSNGAVSSYAAATGQIVVLAGTTNISANFSLATQANPQGLAVTYSGRTWSVTSGLDAAEDTATLTIRANGSGAYSGVTFDVTVQLAKLRGGYEVVSTLPTTNQAARGVVFNETDKKLYRWDGSAWGAVIDVDSAVDGAKLDPGTVRMESLLIAPKGLVADSSFATGAGGWTGFVRRLAKSNPAVPANCPTAFAAEFNARDNPFGARIPVREGEQYRIGGWVNRDQRTSGAGGVGFFGATYTSAGVRSGFVFPGIATTASGWQYRTGTWTVPAGAVELEFGPWADRPTYTGPAWYADFTIEKMADANLIVDGGILARNVNAEVFTGDAFNAGVVTAAQGEFTELSALSADLGEVTAGLLRNAGNTARFDLGNSRIQFIGAAFMKVTGLGFGSAGQFIEWYGPVQAALADCEEGNALYYLKTDGSMYWGGATDSSDYSAKTLSTGPMAAGSNFDGVFFPMLGSPIKVFTRSVGSVDVAAPMVAVTFGAGAMNVTYKWQYSADNSSWSDIGSAVTITVGAGLTNSTLPGIGATVTGLGANTAAWFRIALRVNSFSGGGNRSMATAPTPAYAQAY